MRVTFVICVAILVGLSAFSIMRAAEGEETESVSTEMRQLAFTRIAQQLSLMELPLDKLRDFDLDRDGSSENLGYTTVRFLYVRDRQCIAFQTRCKINSDVEQCIDVTWYPYHEHKERCPISLKTN